MSSSTNVLTAIETAEKKWDKFTKEELAFISRYKAKFFALPHEQHRNADVGAFKKDFAEAFVQHFGFTSDVDQHRRRAIRKLSNIKRDYKTKGIAPPVPTVSKKDTAILADFFEKHASRKISGKDLFMRENKELINKCVADIKASTEGSKRGLDATVKRDVYNALSEEKKAEYDCRANEENGESSKALMDNLSVEMVAENQNKLKDAISTFISSLSGRKNSFSVGDAVFSVHYAFISAADGSMKTDSVHTVFKGASFEESRHYEKSRVRKSWKAFAKEILLKPNTESCGDTPTNNCSLATSDHSTPTPEPEQSHRLSPSADMSYVSSVPPEPPIPLEQGAEEQSSLLLSYQENVSIEDEAQTKDTNFSQSSMTAMIPMESDSGGTANHPEAYADPDHESEGTQPASMLQTECNVQVYLSKAISADAESISECTLNSEPVKQTRKRKRQSAEGEQLRKSHRKLVLPSKPDVDFPTPKKKRPARKRR